MAITYNKNSWLRFLDTNDVSWNDLTNHCNGEEWCYPVDDALLSRFHVTPGEGAELISNGDFSSPLYAGTNDGITAFKLIDSTATFAADAVGERVVNTTDETFTTVGSLDSGTQLGLFADQYPAPSGDLYEISGWHEGTGWKINRAANPGVAKATPGTPSNLTWNTNRVAEGRIYKVTYTIKNYVAGNIFPKVGGNAGTGRSSNGTYTESIMAAGYVSTFQFEKDTQFSADIDDVSVILLDDVVMALKNCDTGEIVKVLENNSGLSSKFQYFNSMILVTLLWGQESLINNTCYCLCTYDPDVSEKIANPTFDNSGANWFVTPVNSAVVFSGDKLNYTTTGPLAANSRILSSFNPLTIGKEYIVRFTIDSIANAKVSVYAGSNITATEVTTVGTHYFVVTATGSTQAGIWIESLTTGGAVIMDNVSFIDIEDEERCSECFQYKTEQVDVMKYFFYGNEDQFGFKYGTLSGALAQQLYLHSRIGKGIGVESIEDHLDSAGLNSILYGQSRRQREIIFGDMPEWVHWAMAKAFLHDNMNIFESLNVTAKYKKVPSDWEPIWEEFRNIAPVIIDVEENDQPESINSNC